MYAREPWQSRSPTGLRMAKPSVSPTLKKPGHDGPRSQIGRGLPVKRKALVILTVAILAFAMIPALGTQAAEGEVKIVTPDQLASPETGSGSIFDRIESAEFVSTVTGSGDLQDASGTLFVVIEDNDGESNTLQPVSAIYDDPRRLPPRRTRRRPVPH